MEALPGPSNPNLVKFVDYFQNVEFYKEEADVVKQFSKPEDAQKELERKRRIGELIAIIWAYYDDIKHLMVDGIKIIPYKAEAASSSSKTAKNAHKHVKHFKDCLPVKLCIQVTCEPSVSSESHHHHHHHHHHNNSHNRRDSSSPSPARRQQSSSSSGHVRPRSASSRRPADNASFVPSVFVQLNFSNAGAYANYPSTSAHVSVDVVQAFHLSKAKAALLRQLARRHVEANSGKELIYGLLWEMKYYLTVLAALPDDHHVLHGDRKQGVELLLQLGGPSYLTAIASGLDEALEMKQQKLRQKQPKQSKKLTVTDDQSGSAGKQTIRRFPAELGDLISGKVLTEESGRRLMPRLKSFTFTPRTSSVPDSVPITVSLHDPHSETFLYTLSGVQFVCQLTHYQAYCTAPQSRYRLTTIQFDLTHIANRTFVEFWPTVAAHLEERLKLFFSKEAVNHYLDQTSNISNLTIAEQISKYEYFDVKFEGPQGTYVESKSELTQITFTIVKEAFYENENENRKSKYIFKLSDLKTAFNLGSLRLSEDRKHMYTSRLLTTLDHLHKSQFFYGEFNPEKIYVAQDGSVKLFDPYLETLAMVFIPFVFENEIEVSKNALRVFEQPEFEEYFVKMMFSNDVFNFGSFVLSIVTDFQFDPIMLVASGFDLEKSKFSKMLIKKLTSNVNKASLIDFISLCINPNVYERTELNMLLHHSYVLEWNARVVKEIALQPQKDSHDTNVYEKSLLEASVNSQLNQENDTDLNFLAQISKYSRSEAEFKPLCLLGKGGFGSVIKVQNRLDEFYYALKRIAIEEDEIHKLRREVQHLSRLSHPNVTRYFAAWTETYNENWEYLFKGEKQSDKGIDEYEDDDDEKDDDDESNGTEKDDCEKTSQKQYENSDSLVDFRNDASKVNDYGNTDECDFDECSDEESDSSSTGSSSDTEFQKQGTSPYENYDESSIGGLEVEFAHSQAGDENELNDTEESSVQTITELSPKRKNKKKRIQSKTKSRSTPRYCLCIQMELCEMDTLQTQIAKKRFLNNPEYKVRVLSEILSALDYIHKMNIIHRDLKPQNILFDSKNRAKIGDFGLALAVTGKPGDADAEPRQEHNNTTVQLDVQLSYKNSSSSSSAKGSSAESHSVGIGTALYMAPEIYFDAHYTNLVDIFSLGVIIVEMCYPMETQSERARVLGNLKPQKTQDMSTAAYAKMISGFEPSFPADIGKYVTEKELKLLKSLLDVCPKNRPSADRLLKEGVFGVVAVDEKRNDDDLIELELLSQKKKMQIQSIIDDSGSPHYHFMIRSLFAKNYSVFDTTLFDFNGVNESSESFYSSLFQFNLASRLIETLSRQFGSLHLQSMPFLLPKGVLYQSAKETVDSCPLLNSDGFIVSLPTNIRLQLARYLALSGNPAQFLTRSTMERVFYKQHLGQYHPKEFWTSSFDLIWPRAFSKETIIPYVEILSFSTQILCFFLPLPLKTLYQSYAFTFDDYTLVFNLTNLSIFQAICNHLQINSKDYQTILTLLADNQENILKNSFHDFNLSAKMELAKSPESNASYGILLRILSVFANSPNDLQNHIYTQLCSSYKSQAVKHFMTTQIDPLIAEMETMHRLWCSATAKMPISPEAIKFRFGLSVVSHTTFYYNHILLHATLEQQSRIVSVVAIGGRYDGMINGYESLYKRTEKDIAQKKPPTTTTEEQSQYNDNDFWPTWEKKPPGESNADNNVLANLSLDFADRSSASKGVLEQKPFQPKHALGVSFSIDKLSRFLSLSSETSLGVINSKFQKFFPFDQQPLGHLETPNLIDLLIVPSSAGQNISRLAQHFRSRGLRVILMPELGPRESKPTLSRFAEDEPRLEMVNRYACSLQIRLVLLIDHYSNAAIRHATINHFVVREYVHGIGYDGQPITAAKLRNSGGQYVLLDGGGAHRWKVHPASSSESATIAAVLTACGLDPAAAESSITNQSGTWAAAAAAAAAAASGITSEELAEQQQGSPSSSGNNVPSGGSEEQSTADREQTPFARTHRSASISVKPNQSAGGGGGAGQGSYGSAGNAAAFGGLPSSPNQSSPLYGGGGSTGNLPPTSANPNFFSAAASSCASNFDIDFICANKSADRRRLSTSILSFVQSKLPALSSAGIRVLAIDVSYAVVKALADIVDSDLLADFLQQVHSASTLFETSSSGGALSAAEANNVLENLKNYFFSRFKDLLTRNKRDSDIINKTISEMWESIQKRLKQCYGNRGITPNFIFVLVAYKDGIFKYRLISF